MRTLVFIPNYGHNSRAFFKDEIGQRLKIAAQHNLGEMKPIDAEEIYAVSDWDTLITTLKHYKSDFDCLVIAIDGKEVNERWNIKGKIAAITENTSGMPVVAYVDAADAATAFRLMHSDFSFVVDRTHDERTLAMAVGRAVALRSASGRLLKVGPLGIDMTSGELFLNDNRIHLTKRESELLLLLARRKGMVVGKDQLMSFMYDGADEAPEQKIIDVFICKIRKKLNELNAEYPMLGSIIETVWGRGIRLINYAPEELKFTVGPLSLHYSMEKKKFVSFDGKFEFNDAEIVILGFLAEAGNKPVSLDQLQENLANADHGFMSLPVLKQTLETLKVRVANQYTGESMLRVNEDGTWTLFNPYHGLKAAEKRFMEVMELGTEEIVDGIPFRHVENFSYVYGPDNRQLARLSATQFKFFKFLAMHKGKGFVARDLYRVLLSPTPSMLLQYANQLRVIVQRMNKSMKKVPGYTPVHLMQNDKIIGMAASWEQLTLPKEGEKISDFLPSAQGNGGGFSPVSRGIGKDGKPVIDEAGLFNLAEPFSLINMGKFTLRVNNQTRSSFIPSVMVSFTAPETILLLKMWYANGAPVNGEITVNGKPTPSSVLAVEIVKKLGDKSSDWKNAIQPTEDGSYCFGPPRPEGAKVVATGPAEEQRLRAG